jgi:hypothetical protein
VTAVSIIGAALLVTGASAGIASWSDARSERHAGRRWSSVRTRNRVAALSTVLFCAGNALLSPNWIERIAWSILPMVAIVFHSRRWQRT